MADNPRVDSGTYARLLRSKLARIMPGALPTASPFAAFDRLNSEIDAC